MRKAYSTRGSDGPFSAHTLENGNKENILVNVYIIDILLIKLPRGTCTT